MNRLKKNGFTIVELLVVVAMPRSSPRASATSAT
jgi:hypothetical protein